MHVKQFIVQSMYAALTIFSLILLLQLGHIFILAPIGASSFIVFAKPNSNPAKARNLIGGQLIGLFVGSLCSILPSTPMFYQPLIYALCVGATMFLMVLFGTEHPPAAGTALGVLLDGPSLNYMFSLVISVIVLALVHHLLRTKLVDLV